MEIAVIGDIHGELNKLDAILTHALEGGIRAFIVVGDIARNYLPRSRKDFSAEVKYGASFREVMARFEGLEMVWVRGNHDAPDIERGDPRCIDGLTSGLLGRVRVLGYGGAPNKFGWPNEWPDVPLRALPGDAMPDILVTHCPPSKVLADCWGDDGGSHRIAAMVDFYRPAVHVFGHIHHQRGSWFNGETLFVNAGALGPPDSVCGYMRLASDAGGWEVRSVEV